MGRDGVLPKVFKEVDARTLTPIKNTLVTCTFIAILAALLPITKLWDLVSIGTLAAFIVVSSTVIILRVTRPDLPRSFKVPGYPVTPVLAIISCCYVGTKIPIDTWLLVIAWVLLALVFYFTYSHRHSILAEPAGSLE